MYVCEILSVFKKVDETEVAAEILFHIMIYILVKQKLKNKQM